MKFLLTVLLACCGLCCQAARPHYEGVYAFSSESPFDENEEGPSGELLIYPERGNTFHFSLFKSRGAPSYNMGMIEGEIVVYDGEAIFSAHVEEWHETDCVLHFVFGKNKVTVTEDSDRCACGFGYGVYIQDEFLRVSRKVKKSHKMAY